MSNPGEDALQALESKARELCQAGPVMCAECGQDEATCTNDYYPDGVRGEQSCDECCAHNGACVSTPTRAEQLANLSALFLTLSECIQRLVPEHNEAGAHFEELAVMCNEAVYGPSKSRRVFTYPERL